MSDYPALENFLAAYFHQDWQAEHATPDAVVAGFRADEDDEQVAAVRDDLARLSAASPDEDGLAARLRALGSEYDPTRDGRTWQAWLQSLRTQFA